MASKTVKEKIKNALKQAGKAVLSTAVQPVGGSLASKLANKSKKTVSTSPAKKKVTSTTKTTTKSTSVTTGKYKKESKPLPKKTTTTGNGKGLMRKSSKPLSSKAGAAKVTKGKGLPLPAGKSASSYKKTTPTKTGASTVTRANGGKKTATGAYKTDRRLYESKKK